MIPAHIINVKAIYALLMQAPFAQFPGTYCIGLAVCVLALCVACSKPRPTPRKDDNHAKPF